MFLPHFETDVFYDLLLSRPTATWNLFVLYSEERRKNDTHTCLVPLDCSRICVKFSSKCYFLSLLLLFFFILLVYIFSKKFFNASTFSKQNNRKNILQNCESLVAMTHDGNCCEDFLQFRHSQVVKNSFCLLFCILFFTIYQFLLNFFQGFHLLNLKNLTIIFKTTHHVEKNKTKQQQQQKQASMYLYLYSNRSWATTNQSTRA